jgi:hypothetical protein
MAISYDFNIPASGGVFSERGNEFSNFNPFDAAVGFFDVQVDAADIVGSFYYPVSMTTRNNIITFEGRNVTSLQSFWGQNILGHGTIKNKTSGPLSNTEQIFRWQVPIPKEYQE